MRNETQVAKKIAQLFINIGNVHVNSLSSMIGYYEPKISADLLKKAKKQDK